MGQHHATQTDLQEELCFACAPTQTERSTASPTAAAVPLQTTVPESILANALLSSF